MKLFVDTANVDEIRQANHLLCYNKSVSYSKIGKRFC